MCIRSVLLDQLSHGPDEACCQCGVTLKFLSIYLSIFCSKDIHTCKNSELCNVVMMHKTEDVNRQLPINCVVYQTTHMKYAMISGHKFTVVA